MVFPCPQKVDDQPGPAVKEADKRGFPAFRHGRRWNSQLQRVQKVRGFIFRLAQYLHIISPQHDVEK